MSEREELASLCDQYRHDGKRVGFINGCFDCLHAGHQNLINIAAANCELLVIAINSDKSVMRMKGSLRPIQRYENRAKAVAALCPDKKSFAIVEMDEDSPLRLVQITKPAFLFKQPEYKGSREVLYMENAKGIIIWVPRVPDISTSTFSKGK